MKTKLAKKEEKKDLIDLVREGKAIEIYEANSELKEGDAISDWATSRYYNGEVRTIVGRPSYRIRFWPILLRPRRCPYCKSQMHEIIRETRQSRKGRDGRQYFIYAKEALSDVICCLCEYEYDTWYNHDF